MSIGGSVGELKGAESSDFTTALYDHLVRLRELSNVERAYQGSVRELVESFGPAIALRAG